MARRESFGQRAVRAQVERRGGQATLLDLCIIRAGLKRGPAVLMSVWWWAAVCREHPESPSGELLGVQAQRSAATGYRLLAELRDLFPDDELDELVAFVERVRAGGVGVEPGSDEMSAAAVGAVVVEGIVP